MIFRIEAQLCPRDLLVHRGETDCSQERSSRCWNLLLHPLRDRAFRLPCLFDRFLPEQLTNGTSALAPSCDCAALPFAFLDVLHLGTNCALLFASATLAWARQDCGGPPTSKLFPGPDGLEFEPRWSGMGDSGLRLVCVLPGLSSSKACVAARGTRGTWVGSTMRRAGQARAARREVAEGRRKRVREEKRETDPTEYLMSCRNK